MHEDMGKKKIKDIGNSYRKFRKNYKKFLTYTLLSLRDSGTYYGSSQITVTSPSPVIMLTKNIQTHFYLISQCPWFPFTFPTLAQEGPQGNMWAALVQHRMMTLRYNVCKAALAKSP